MTKVILSAAFALSMVSYQAGACDWNKEAASTPVIVADGSNCNGCASEQTTGPTIQEPLAPAASKIATDKPLDTPVAVSDCNGNNC
jgi:hypothetical protein